MSDAPNDALPIVERNVESRTVLAFRAEEALLQPLLPPGWALRPPAQGPSRGASLNVILAERLLVEDADGRPMDGQATNRIAVLAVPVQLAGGYPPGVLILGGLSAQLAGAPGPYGVFAPAAAQVERVLRGAAGAVPPSTEHWSFAGEALRLELRLSYAAAAPVRAQTETVAYSAADPNFHRIYHADQGTDVLRSVPDRLDRVGTISFSAAAEPGHELAPLLAGLPEPLSVLSLPWTVRRATVAPVAALLGIQSRDPAAFGLPYLARGQAMWADSPYQPAENGTIEPGERVWLDRDLPRGAHGPCRVRLADGRLRYIADAARLAGATPPAAPAAAG